MFYFLAQNSADEDDDFIPPGQPNGVVRSDQLTQESDEPKDCSLFLSPCLTNPAKRLSFMVCAVTEWGGSVFLNRLFMNALFSRRPTMNWLLWNILGPLKKHPLVSNGYSLKHNLKAPKISLLNLLVSSVTNLKVRYCCFQCNSCLNIWKQVIPFYCLKILSDSQEDVPAFTNTSTNSESEVDLMALCSGKFVTQVPNPKELEEECTQPFISSGSQFPSQMSSADECPTAPQDADDSVVMSCIFSHYNSLILIVLYHVLFFSNFEAYLVNFFLFCLILAGFLS